MINYIRSVLRRRHQRKCWKQSEDYHRSRGHLKTAAFYHNLQLSGN